MHPNPAKALPKLMLSNPTQPKPPILANPANPAKAKANYLKSSNG